VKTKGKVERPIRYLRENFFYGRSFLNDADLDAQAQRWLTEVANVRVHATTGERPIEFAADGLPRQIRLDPATGILSGAAPTQRGEHLVTIRAKNARGSTSKAFRIVAGDTLALTPPMGWNSWYIYYNRVTEKNMRDAADCMISSGMADFGYQYVNIDDCWSVKEGTKDPTLQGEPRDPEGRINSNKRFPDMKALTDFIHSLGLKAGIYTSPGPTTCAGHVAAYQHEELDTARFVEWGFDFLKYDWCSYGDLVKDPDREALERPYRLASSILRTWTGTSCSTCASTGWETCGNGGRRSVASPGGPLATSASSWTGSSTWLSRTSNTAPGRNPAVGTTPTTSRLVTWALPTAWAIPSPVP
jgi:hypothetical protein